MKKLIKILLRNKILRIDTRVEMNNTCGAFKYSNGIWSFSYDNVDVWQLVQTLMTSNEMLWREVCILTQGRRRRRRLKLKALAKNFKPTLDDMKDKKAYDM